MNFVDVALDAPVLHANPAWATGDQTFALDLGVATALGAWRVQRADLVLLTGVHLTSRAFEQQLRMATWHVPVEGGWRWTSTPDTDFVRPYWELGGGPHLMLLLVSWTPPLVDIGIGTHTGIGATVGRGDLRVVVGLRGSAVVGFDSISGHVTRPAGDVSWGWAPFAARLDGYAGVSFR